MLDRNIANIRSLQKRAFDLANTAFFIYFKLIRLTETQLSNSEYFHGLQSNVYSIQLVSHSHENKYKSFKNN